MGAGIYFVKEYDIAAKIGKRWGDDGAVVEVRIKRDSWTQREHGAWARVTSTAFQEYCVPDDKNIRIVKVHAI